MTYSKYYKRLHHDNVFYTILIFNIADNKTVVFDLVLSYTECPTDSNMI